MTFRLVEQLIGPFRLSGDSGQGLTAIYLAIIITACVPLLLAAVGRLNVFSPPILFSVCLLLGYVLPFQQVLAGQDIITVAFNYHSVDVYEGLARALTLVLLGTFGFYAGYAVSQRRKIRRTEAGWRNAALPSVKRNLIIGVVLYTGLALVLFGIGIVLLGGVSAYVNGLYARVRTFEGLNYFFSGVNLCPVAALLAWTAILRRRAAGCHSSTPFWFWPYVVVAGVLTALQGAKSPLVVPVLAAVMLYHFLYRRISPAVLLAIGVVSIVAFAFYDLFVKEYMVLRHITSVDTTLPTGELVGYLSSRALTSSYVSLQVLMALVEIVPDALPLQHGATALSILTAPLPIKLFPIKFFPATGIFTATMWPALMQREGTTFPVGLIGECYMNFGAVGVMVGLAVFGYWSGVMFAGIVNREGGYFGLISRVLGLASMMHYMRGDVYAGTVLLLIYLVPLSFGVRLFGLTGLRRRPARLQRARVRSDMAVQAARGLFESGLCQPRDIAKKSDRTLRLRD